MIGVQKQYNKMIMIEKIERQNVILSAVEGLGSMNWQITSLCS